MASSKFPRLKTGNNLNVIELLSANSRGFLHSKSENKVPLTYLNGKFVVICAFQSRSTRSKKQLTQAIRALGLELERLGVDDVAIVMAVHADTIKDKSSFRKFFHRFHNQCLAIPYSEYESRALVCDYIYGGAAAFSPVGDILVVGSYFFQTYGSKLYPFSRDNYINIGEQTEIKRAKIDFIHWNRNKGILPHLANTSLPPLSLQELLGSESLLSLHSLKSKSISSVINKFGGTEKTVGVYLLNDGSCVDIIKRFQRQSVAQGNSFEIVVIDVGLDTDPSLVLEKLQRLELPSNWWTIDPCDYTCRSVWRVGGAGFGDKLIILPRHRPGSYDAFSGDLEGLEVGRLYGDDAYPFTKESIVDKKFRYLKGFNLFTFLEDNKIDCGIRRGCKTLVYFDYVGLSFIGDDNLCTDVKLCVPSLDDDVQILFVSLDDDFDGSQQVPWPVIPTAFSRSLVSKLFLDGLYPDEFVCSSLMSFSSNGELVQRRTDRYLRDKDKSCLFQDRLRSEILHQVCQKVDAY